MILFLAFSLYLHASQISYVRKVPFTPRAGTHSVIFGTPETGYFETAAKPFRFIPPTYHKPIEFYEKKEDRIACRLRSQFHNPTPKGHQVQEAKVTGSLLAPFFLTNGYTPFEAADVQDPKGHAVVFILNRLGETVWSYAPDKVPPSSDHRTRTWLAKSVGPKSIGLLRPYDRSKFELIDWEAHLLQTLTPKDGVFHHDFLFEKDSFISLSTQLKSLRKPWLFWRSPVNFLDTPLLAYDAVTHTSKILWSYLDRQNPFFESDWTWNAVDSNPERSNFTHINSIAANDQGYLLSSRNLNKLIFVDRKSNQLLWTVGRSAKNTFPTKGTESEFFRQHHASFLEDRTLLLFDNGRDKSRILNIELAQNTKRPRLVSAYWPTPPVHSTRHGSAFVFAAGTVVGFFPNTTPGSVEPNRIIEFDKESNAERGRLEFRFGYTAAAYRAEPLAQLFNATPYSGRLPSCYHR